MKKLIACLSLMLFLGFYGSSFAQIVLDGDSTDWVGEPVLATALDNLQDYFPDEIGAAFSDRVDIKQVKAKIVDNVFYFYIKFWGGPVWPNHAYEEDLETGEHVVRNRGYYHLMLDLDNDATTGWNSHWYETHYTPVGYYHSQALPNTDDIGAEAYLELGIDSHWTPPKEDGMYKYISYSTYDVHEVDYHAGTGNEADISGFDMDNPDSAKATKFGGLMIDEISEDGMLYYCGHAWGSAFV